ncbi:metallophosphoesterase [Xanthovirga aplysinae]|uniref:metallophosphoesterase n=1 Tax=Xanthovirga aplysinae TaxID=2529853 RepID=UPI0012BB6FD0|nr:metallophosphoesterase [Xanthovirga aplysinae]MTI29656.1 T9SS type A sorting domain-containing protein [Xanthovirga aplysinae]
MKTNSLLGRYGFSKSRTIFSILFLFLINFGALKAQNVKVAAIGDFGLAGDGEKAVADLVKSWNVDGIITLGDNNYEDGEASTIDENVGQYYHEFIGSYKGEYGEGASSNKFWPSLGNHDWYTPNAQPYLDYFELPNNERYYDFEIGDIHFFVVDSDPNEPSGVTSSSRQGRWLQRRMEASSAQWKVVYFHHAPYSSGRHGGESGMQWPFKEWGATAVIAAHDHHYERIIKDDFVYFVNGLGGASRYSVRSRISGSQVDYDDNDGAMLIEASSSEIVFKFINVEGTQIDSYTISSNSAATVAKTTAIDNGLVQSDFKENTKVVLAPNPAPKGQFDLSVNLGEEESVNSLLLTNVEGALVWEKEVSLKGNSKESFNLSHLPRGLYYLQLIGNNFKITEELIIE